MATVARLLVANLKIILRDRQTLFWALVFPLIFVVVFGLFDLGGGPGNATGAVIDQTPSTASQALRAGLAQVDFLEVDAAITDEAVARERLAGGDLEFVLIIPAGFGTSAGTLTLLYDEANTTTNQVLVSVFTRFVDEVNLRIAGAPRLVTVEERGLRTQQVSYFDFLLIGLVGMGVMFNSVIVVAVRVSTYRELRVLKRLLATPLRVGDYFAAIVGAHLVLAVVQTGIILAAGVFLFDATVRGNMAWLFVLIAVGNIVFLNIGFIIAAFAKTPAAASGMGNVIAMPMMFFSGTFFPTDSLPAFLPRAVRLLPLTPLLEATRTVGIDAGVPWDAPAALGLLAAWIVGSSLVAVRVFRFR